MEEGAPRGRSVSRLKRAPLPRLALVSFVYALAPETRGRPLEAIPTYKPSKTGMVRSVHPPQTGPGSSASI